MEGKLRRRLTFNPGLTLTGFRTTLMCFQRETSFFKFSRRSLNEALLDYTFMQKRKVTEKLEIDPIDKWLLI